MKTKTKTCAIFGCERPCFARGYCRLHYKRWWTHGDPNRCLIHIPNRFHHLCDGRTIIWLEKRTGEFLCCYILTLDYPLVANYRWVAAKDKHGQTIYARSKIQSKNGKHTTISMHRLIMGVTDPTIEIDHIDHDGLHNWADNLRTATRQQNAANTSKHKNGLTAKYKGVRRDKNKFRAKIQASGKIIDLGSYDHEYEAALAYNNEASEQFGEFALLNDVNAELMSNF